MLNPCTGPAIPKINGGGDVIKKRVLLYSIGLKLQASKGWS